MGNYYKDNDRLEKYLNNQLMNKVVSLHEQNFSYFKTDKKAPQNTNDAIFCYKQALVTLGEICADTIAVNSVSVDDQGPVFKDGSVFYHEKTIMNNNILKLASLYGITLPRSYGGLFFPITVSVMASEIIARADASFQNIWSLQDCAETILRFGSEDLKSELLPLVCNGATCSMDLTEPNSGSDLQSVSLKASWNEKDSVWRLNGVKRFITNGDADIHLVLARSEDNVSDGRGLSLFVYRKSDKGMTVRRIENKIGIVGSPTCEISFNNAPASLIGERKMGLIKYVMSLMNMARLGIGAQSVGIGEAAIREAEQYAATRKQFGVPIISLPAIREMIRNMRSKLDASRALLYETAYQADISKALMEKSKSEELTPTEKIMLKESNKRADMLTPILKLISSEYCNQIAYDAIQIFGGSGYVKDFIVERLYRDARVTSIYEGTSQMQVVAASKYIINKDALTAIDSYLEKIKDNRAKEILTELRDELKNAIDYCSIQPREYSIFHMRRMVEMAGCIIMSALLYINCEDLRDKESALFHTSTTVALVKNNNSLIQNRDFFNSVFSSQ